MRLKLMSDVQYLSPKRAVKVRDQSFLLGVSIKHRYCGGGESTPTNNTPSGSQTFARNVGRIYLDKQNTLSRLESYDDISEIVNTHSQYNWDSLFDGVSETARFDAIEALFSSTGVDLKKIAGADPEPCRTEMTVTSVKLNGSDSIVLFAPSLGQAVAAFTRSVGFKSAGTCFCHFLSQISWQR